MKNIRDIYEVLIYFDDGSNDFKSRPVLIINKQIVNESNIFTIVELTSIPPKNPPTYYDEFKIPIRKWKESGLDKKSYVKTRNIHRIMEDKLYKYIGEMDIEDFKFVFSKVIDNFS